MLQTKVRSPEEIVARIAEITVLTSVSAERAWLCDWLGTERNDLITCLPFEHAAPLLRRGATAAGWEPNVCPADPESVERRAREYLPFAVAQCLAGGALATERTMHHYSAWTWLMGDDEAVTFVREPDHFPLFGAPVLLWLAGRYEWPIAAVDRAALVRRAKKEGL